MLPSFSPAILGAWAPRVANVEHTQTSKLSPADLAESARRLSQQTALLLPGALALLGVQAYAFTQRLSRLDAIQGFVLTAATLWTLVSIIAFFSLLGRIRLARMGTHQQQSLEAIRLRLAGTTSALLVGATADLALALDIITGSWTIAGVAAGVLVAIACWVCW